MCDQRLSTIGPMGRMLGEPSWLLVVTMASNSLPLGSSSSVGELLGDMGVARKTIASKR